MSLILSNLFLLCLVYLCDNICNASHLPHKHPTPTPYHDWDFLMFSQRWPITACAQWEGANAANTCDLPPDGNEWIIHGIWPTKFGTEGPLFCPSAIHFDPNQLDLLLNDLKDHWTNVEANTKPYSFWKHEWDKHGTCASTLPQLDSIPNFFTRALVWNKLYNLTNFLAESKIIPGTSGYTANQISDAIKSVTKYNPMVQCVVDSKTKQSMISEIRICLNKSMELMDCDQTNPNKKRSSTVLTNCSEKKPVMYLGTLPPHRISYQMDYMDEYFQKYQTTASYMELYKLLKFLIWYTI